MGSEHEGGEPARACSHDEATLRSAAEDLRAAESDARAGQAEAEKARAVEWSGTAGDSFRSRAAVIVAELAAVTAGVVGLGILVGSAQREAAECASTSPAVVAADQGPGPATAGPRLPLAPPGRAVLPYESRGPLVPYETGRPLLLWSDPARGPASSAAPGPGEVCR
ncbi:hypothetical protein [Sinomonas sp. ASV322]|uniref:hypothetical protein n=1 Tax=Sinomonas sp. ASV322 TaxID=3041920 RepID=UPI0027DB4408|nr:hypothetical protein [Sinomonas sp. ASV322]MDQ4503500.1 hypothetical protein [Sinomonas sp. ASV322]